jgi:hypothetical protein
MSIARLGCGCLLLLVGLFVFSSMWVFAIAFLRAYVARHGVQ